MDDTKTPVSPSGQDTGNLGLPPMRAVPAEPEQTTVATTVETPGTPVTTTVSTTEAETPVTTTVVTPEVTTTTTTEPMPAVVEPGAEVKPSEVVLPVPVPEPPSTGTTVKTTVTTGGEPKKKVSKKVLIGGLVVAVLAVGVVAVAALFPQFRGAMQQRASILECTNNNDCGLGWHCSGGKCVANSTGTPPSTPPVTTVVTPYCSSAKIAQCDAKCQDCHANLTGGFCSGPVCATTTPPPTTTTCSPGSSYGCSGNSAGTTSCSPVGTNQRGTCETTTVGGTLCYCRVEVTPAPDRSRCATGWPSDFVCSGVIPGSPGTGVGCVPGNVCTMYADSNGCYCGPGSSPPACESNRYCNGSKPSGSAACTQSGGGVTYCCPSGQTIVNNACVSPDSCPDLSTVECANYSVSGSRVCKGTDGRIRYCCPPDYSVTDNGCVAPTPTNTCANVGGVCHYTQCSTGYHAISGSCAASGSNFQCCAANAPTTYPVPTCAAPVIPCPLGKICVPNTSGGSCVLEANVTPYCSNLVLPCPHGQYCVPDKRGGTCVVLTMTPRPSGSPIPTGTGGACGGLNQPCCAPENVGAGSICNNGLYCHPELGFKCTADASICTGGGVANGQCKVFDCGSKCNAGNQCTTGGTVVACSQASALLGGRCGQIDYEKVGGGYCGVKVQNCYGACGGGGTPSTTPTVTQSPTCPFSSTQGQVHRNDQLPWADAIPNTADTNVMLPGQSFKIGGFHNGSGTLATDVIYTIFAGTTQLATHPVTSANDAIWTYTIAAGQTGTLTVKTTTRNQTGANCQDTATVTIGSVPNACVATRIYLKGSNGQFSTTATPVSQLGSLIHVGDTIRMAVRGNKATFGGGRFIVLRNGAAVGTFEVTQSLPLAGDPATREFYYDYTITQSGNYEIQGAVSVVPPTVTATETPTLTKSPTPSETPMPVITPAWSGHPLPTDMIEATSQYIQPDGRLRINAFRGNRMWGYTCAFNADGTTVASCTATTTRTLAEAFAGISGGATAWAGNPIPTDRVDAVDNFMQPGGTLRTNVYKGNRYWAFNCTFQAGTATVTGCNAVTTRSLSEAFSGIAGAATAWAGNPIPVDFVDGVDSYVQANGVLRSTVFKGGRYWGFECTYQAGTATVTGCMAKTTMPLTQWASGIGGSYAVALPTDSINAIGQVILPNGKARSNVFKGGRYWAYDCVFNTGATGVTSCSAVTTLSLTQWAAGILPQ